MGVFLFRPSSLRILRTVRKSWGRPPKRRQRAAILCRWQRLEPLQHGVHLQHSLYRVLLCIWSHLKASHIEVPAAFSGFRAGGLVTDRLGIGPSKEGPSRLGRSSRALLTIHPS